MQNAEARARHASAFCILHSALVGAAMKLIPRAEPLNATVQVPPSKSYSVRALLLAAMSEGTTTVTNGLDSDDTRYALEALRAVGFEVAGTLRDGARIGPRRSMSANEVPVFV